MVRAGVTKWAAILTLVYCCEADAGAEPVRLALNWKPEPQFGGFYASQVDDAYKNNALDVTIIEGGSGTPTIQVLGAGKVEYAVVSADEVVISHDRGAKNVIALFATFQTNPQAIMTHAERGFHTLEDVLKSDGMLLWQAGLPYAQYLTKKYAPIKVTRAPYLGGIGNFQNDPKLSQQCFATSEPLTAARAGLEVTTFLIAESGYNPYTTVLVTTREHLQRHPDQVQRMVAAVRAGWEAYLKDPTRANAAMGALNKAMDAQTFIDSAAAQAPLIRTGDATPLGAMTLARWRTLVDQLVVLKSIKKPVNPQDLFANR
jgi:NitT/TauT family transport system substrate-binding protein